jgi:hypothetical protein
MRQGVLAEAAMKRKKGLPGDDEFASLPDGELDEYSNGEESEELLEDDELDEEDEFEDDDEFDDDLEEDDDYEAEELDDLDADDER